MIGVKSTEREIGQSRRVPFRPPQAWQGSGLRRKRLMPLRVEALPLQSTY